MVEYSQMKRTEYWLSIIIPTVASLIFGGFGLYLLSQFKESLPLWFYNALLYVIYIVFVAVLLFFLILVVRAAFGEWLQRQILNSRQRTNKRKLAKNLFYKWLELHGLISDILKNEDKRPTIEQGKRYTDLHLWFVANRSTFLPEWRSFDDRRINTAHDDDYWDTQRDLGYMVLRETRDPFSYFYEPLNAEILMLHLRDEPTSEIDAVLNKLSELTLEFVKWINR